MSKDKKSILTLVRVFDIDAKALDDVDQWPKIDVPKFNVEYLDGKLIEDDMQIVDGCDFAIFRFARRSDLCKARIAAVRKAGIRIPILVLSASTQSHLAAALLDTGADDFMAADVDVEELRSRMKASVRKAGYEFKVAGSGLYHSPDITRLAGLGIAVPTNLSARESVLLSVLSERPDHWVSKSRLEDALRPGRPIRSNIIASTICGLRRKLAPGAILTARQLGYCLLGKGRACKRIVSQEVV